MARACPCRPARRPAGRPPSSPTPRGAGRGGLRRPYRPSLGPGLLGLALYVAVRRAWPLATPACLPPHGASTLAALPIPVSSVTSPISDCQTAKRWGEESNKRVTSLFPARAPQRHDHLYLIRDVTCGHAVCDYGLVINHWSLAVRAVCARVVLSHPVALRALLRGTIIFSAARPSRGVTPPARVIPQSDGSAASGMQSIGAQHAQPAVEPMQPRRRRGGIRALGTGGTLQK